MKLFRKSVEFTLALLIFLGAGCGAVLWSAKTGTNTAGDVRSAFPVDRTYRPKTFQQPWSGKLLPFYGQEQSLPISES